MTPEFHLCLFVAAALYASVGHGGGSAYLAVMAIFGVAPEVMKPSSLSLNILVSSIALQRFSRHSEAPSLRPVPLLCGSIPLAFVGSNQVQLGPHYKVAVGLVLFLAGLRMLYQPPLSEDAPRRTLTTWQWWLIGAVIGLASGATGTGGGIFLSALLLSLQLGDSRQVARVSALFILCNSIAGLLGAHSLWSRLPGSWPFWAVASVSGGLVGAHYGARRFKSKTLNQLLAVVLWIAAAKLALVR